MAPSNVLAQLPIAAKVGIGVAWASIIAAGYFFTLHMDLSNSIEAEKSQQQRLTSSLATAKKNEHTFQQDLTTLAKYEQRAKELDRMLPKTAEVPQLVTLVDEVARVSGIQIDAFEPRPEKPGDYFVEVPMRLDVGGRYHQIAKFFYQLGRADRIVNMQDVSLELAKKTADGDSSAPMLKATVLATAFRAMETVDKKGDSSNKRSAAPKKGGK